MISYLNAMRCWIFIEKNINFMVPLENENSLTYIRSYIPLQLELDSK